MPIPAIATSSSSHHAIIGHAVVSVSKTTSFVLSGYTHENKDSPEIVGAFWDIESNTFSQAEMAGDVPSGRIGCTVDFVDGSVYLFGGESIYDGTILDDLYEGVVEKNSIFWHRRSLGDAVEGDAASRAFGFEGGGLWTEQVLAAVQGVAPLMGMCAEHMGQIFPETTKEMASVVRYHPVFGDLL